MKEARKAAFSFEKFQIPRFSFNDFGESAPDLSITFDPSGTYDTEKGVYQVLIEFNAFTNAGEANQIVINALLVADFQFQENLPFDEIPSYFYRNSIAIAFPYLRAFISTLTLQANVKPIVMPVLNLMELEQPLRDNTKVIQSV